MSASAAPALGAPGDLDPSYGTHGIASHGSDEALELAAGFDGDAYVAAYSPDLGSRVLRHLDASGKLDSSFGEDGRVNLAGLIDYVSSVAVQSDGKILVAGSRGPSTDFKMSVVRFLASGQLDTTYGSSGSAQIGRPAIADDVELIDSGPALVSGHSDGHAVALKLTSDGTLDGSFGSGGITDLVSGAERAQLGAYPDGSSLVASSGGMFSEPVVARLTVGGAVDATYGSGGRSVLPQFPAEISSSVIGLSVNPDGPSLLATSRQVETAKGRLNASVVSLLDASGSNHRLSGRGVWRLRRGRRLRLGREGPGSRRMGERRICATSPRRWIVGFSVRRRGVQTVPFVLFKVPGEQLQLNSATAGGCDAGGSRYLIGAPLRQCRPGRRGC